MADEGGYLMLRNAIQKEDVPLVHELLGMKISNPNMTYYDDDVPPLSIAVCNVSEVTDIDRKQHIIDLLIEYGADVNIADKAGNTPLHYASEQEFVCPAQVEKLLSKNADPNIKNINGYTALHCVTNVEDREALENIMDLLIEYGADVNIVDAFGDTPLHHASRNGIIHATEKLLSIGADPNKKNNLNLTVLHYIALLLRDSGIITELGELLVAHGADVNACLANGDSILYTSCKVANMCMTKFLLDKNADINKVGDFGNSPLNYTLGCMCCRDERDLSGIFELLLEYGADVNISNLAGVYPLASAVKTGNVSIVKLIIEHDADVNGRDGRGMTALHYAVMVDMDQIARDEIVALLIEKGIDVNAVEHSNNTALSFVSSKGYFKIAKMLLEQKADPNATNDRGNTPLTIAIKFNHTSIIDLLKQFGADFTNRNPYCETATYLLSASHCAKDPGTSDVTKFPMKFFKNKKVNRRNYLLTWMTHFCNYNSFYGTSLITEKFALFLGQTKDLNQIGYHRRNFLHFLASYFRAIFNNQTTVDFRHLMELTEKYADTSVLNAKDDNGWTPVSLMFIACNFLFSNEVRCSMYTVFNTGFAPLMAAILKKGFKCMGKDHHGASVIHYAAGTRFPKVLKLLLGECTVEFVNEIDNNGSTPLHYAAFANNTDAAQILLDKGCDKSNKDFRGRTACDLAKLLGFGDIVHLLSDEDGSRKADIFNYKNVHTIDRSQEIMNYDDFTEELMKQNANEILAIYASLLKSPVLGTRKCQEQCFQEETQLIEDEVMRLIRRFSERHAHQYPRWAFEPKLRGSMEEGTKCGPPDEFDFLLIMNDLSENCQVNSIDNCKAYTAICDTIDIGDVLKLPPNEMIDALHNVLLLRDSFASDGNSQPLDLDAWLVLTMKEFLMTHATWEGSRMKFVSCDRTNVGLCLNLIFNGHLYKMLHISIDLVPCIRLKMPGPVKVSIDWPFPVDFSQCQLYGLFRTGCDGFDISSTEYEEVLLKSLPTAAIDAYVLGKAFSSAQFKCSGNFGKIFQSSYKMKKALLMSVQLHQNAHAISLHEWIRGMISVAADRNKYAKKSDCLRCIFHAEKWVRGQKNLHLSFS